MGIYEKKINIFFAVVADSRFQANEKYVEQIGRVHGVIVPCIHLCTFAVVAEQFVGWTWRDQAPATTTIAIEQRFQSTLNAGNVAIKENAPHKSLHNYFPFHPTSLSDELTR